MDSVKTWKSLPKWVQWILAIVLAAGIFLRFYQLDHKVYWIDETNSSLRTLGYTKSEFIETNFTGEIVTADQLQQFQRLSPDRGWDDTWKALTGTAEHTPLYFLIARAWVGIVGHSVASMRFLTAVLSVLVLPCLYWLCRELFGSGTVGYTVGWIAMSLVAVTPLHIFYAQEARPYSLLSILILLSSTLLLRAIRLNKPKHWIFYGLSIIAGLYTQLLFGSVAIAHGLFVLLTQGWRNPITRNYSLTSVISGLSLTPWIAILIHNWQKVQQSTTSLNDGYSTSTYLIDRWFLNLNLAFFNKELGGANIFLVLVTMLVLFVFCRQAPKQTWLFVLLLIGIPFMALATPDLILEGRRSLRIRYLFPCFFGLQIAFAYVIATQAVWAKNWQQQLWRVFWIGFLIAGLVASAVSAQEVVGWHKSVPRSSYYPPVADIINQTENALIISDGPVTDTLAFSAWLNPETKLQLLPEGSRKLRIAPGYEPIYLLNPSKQLLKIMTRRGYTLTVAYQDRADRVEIVDRLWTAEKAAK
jgi:uncharacterized membrane protein